MGAIDEDPDAALLERTAAGDMDAFAELVARYERPVFHFIRRMVGPANATEDLAQETFIRVYERASDLRERRSFRPWLWSIAVNLCRDQAKRQRYRDHVPIENCMESDRELAGSASPERELERAEIGRLVDRAIQALPAELRLAIVLRVYAGCSYLEIAAAAGCPVGTVKSRLSAARQQLRRSLAFLLDD